MTNKIPEWLEKEKALVYLGLTENPSTQTIYNDAVDTAFQKCFELMNKNQSEHFSRLLNENTDFSDKISELKSQSKPKTINKDTPRDGTRILILDNGNWVEAYYGAYSENDEEWISDFSECYHTPTHWLPLPSTKGLGEL